MKKRNKLTATLLALGLAASLIACGGGAGSSGSTGSTGSSGGTGSGSNTPPSISGVADASVEAGSEFDALAGITATDAEDGDLTGMIVIDATPSLDFKNGKATPETAGEYELTYAVTDKGGLTAQEYATLTVTKKTGEAVVYKEFDFSTKEVTDNHGWEFKCGEKGDAKAELKEGSYVVDVVSPGEGDGDVQLVKAGFKVQKADYRIRVWAKSTAETYAHLLARDESAEEFSTFGGAFNLKIGPEIAPLDLMFTSPGEGSAELLFNLGKITPNPDEPDDTTPENFTVTIDKIEISEITGEETLTPTFTGDFSGEKDLTVEAGDGAEASVSGAGEVKIDAYPTDGGVWSIKANIGLGDTVIEEGGKYFFRFKIAGEAAQGGECLVESASQYDACRVNFAAFSIDGTEETEVSGIFTADREVTDPVIRLQIGNPSEGVTKNTLTIKDVEFGTVEGDKDVKKTIEAFMAFGPGTENAANPDTPWMTFNGTDEDNERGVGTIWTKDGSFFYRIDNGGTVDWHNKLICGIGGNPLTLESDSYYTVEITAKATKDVSCGVFLNPQGGWDPRFSESMDLTTEEKTFTYNTTDTFITDMDFELLFQFGSEATAQLGEVTVEITNLTIYQMKVM